jgi:hypothetical protein
LEYILRQRTDIQALIIEANGMMNTKVAKSMVLATGLELNNSGLRRCFFDLANTAIDPDQTMTEMFMFVNVFKQAGIDKSVRMAALYTSGGKYRLHLEKSAAFEGLNLKHFTVRDEAIKWLCRYN